MEEESVVAKFRQGGAGHPGDDGGSKTETFQERSQADEFLRLAAVADQNREVFFSA